MLTMGVSHLRADLLAAPRGTKALDVLRVGEAMGMGSCVAAGWIILAHLDDGQDHDTSYIIVIT